MATHSQNVVDTTDTKAFTDESNLCLRVLTQLDTFVHDSNDVCLGQELVRDELSRSNSDCRGPVGTPSVVLPAVILETLAKLVVHVTNFPLKRCYTQVVHVVNDDRFLWGSFRSNFRIGVFEFQQGKRAPSSGDT